METSTARAIHDPAADFYIDALKKLQETGIPFLVGGAFAYSYFSRVPRDTKDIDIFVKPDDLGRVLAAFERLGYDTAVPFPHWLGKIHRDRHFIDVIFSSGNGVARVDELWFEHAPEGEVLERPVRLVPAEEMIWSKSFIMERERFDGADVAHVFHARAADLDWGRLLRRFDGSSGDGGWRVLLAHLTLFGYIYPGDAHLIPNRVMDTLTDRLCQETRERSPETRLCRGTILSRSQYLIDIHRWGYEDARLQPAGNMTAQEVEAWTAAIEKDGDTSQLGVLAEG